ncbi:MAG: exodeoxyribonuclease VII small subunit [Bacteriovoracaceae bacterium]|nr:exodeoxyribonuclease VII small subunit [Bacteriovoracaceae bacterium]
MTKKNKSFEQSLKELESIVSGLETGGLSLEESIKKFEAGVSLYRDCKKQLSVAEKKITTLTDDLKENEIEF